MVLSLILVLFFATALIGVPLVYALLLATTGTIALLGRSYPFEAITLTFMGGIEGLHYVAIPLFILAGELVARGGVGQRLVGVAQGFFAWMPGGLTIVTVMSCMMFGAVSGSAIACAAAIGTIMIPGMAKHGYPRPFSSALIATSGTMGVLVPPSIPLLIYGFIANVSVANLFIASIIPGVLFALSTCIIAVIIAWHNKWDANVQRVDLRALSVELFKSIPALLMPIVILGGIYSGVFTPTESAAVAVVYGMLICTFVYRDLVWADVPQMILRSFITSSVIMIVIGATECLAWLLTIERIPFHLANYISEISDSKIVFLLLLNVVLILLGIFLEPLPALLIAGPLFIPAAQFFGIDLVHLGIVICANLAIGLYTPPVGGTLFVAAKIGQVGMLSISRAIWPMFLANLVVLLIVTFVEPLSLWLVHLLQ